MDMDGPWGWLDVSGEVLKRIKQRLSSFETMTWGEIEGLQSHTVAVEMISSEAQNRLEELRHRAHPGASYGLPCLPECCQTIANARRSPKCCP